MNCKRVIAALVIAAVLIPVRLTAEKKWEKKPSSEWSDSDVQTILHDSPWVAATNIVFIYSRTVGVFQVRLISATPLREAFLRIGALHSSEKTVDVREFGASKKEIEASRLKNFLASEQGQLLTHLESRYIVVSLTLSKHRGIQNDEALPRRFADITPPTLLITDTGRQVRLARFIPPGKHDLGAIFFFPRQRPDGTPFITAEDKELRFTATVKNRSLTAKFNLRKMLYKGKLEF